MYITLACLGFQTFFKVVTAMHRQQGKWQPRSFKMPASSQNIPSVKCTISTIGNSLIILKEGLERVERDEQGTDTACRTGRKHCFPGENQWTWPPPPCPASAFLAASAEQPRVCEVPIPPPTVEALHLLHQLQMCFLSFRQNWWRGTVQVYFEWYHWKDVPLHSATWETGRKGFLTLGTTQGPGQANILADASSMQH